MILPRVSANDSNVKSATADVAAIHGSYKLQIFLRRFNQMLTGAILTRAAANDTHVERTTADFAQIHAICTTDPSAPSAPAVHSPGSLPLRPATGGSVALNSAFSSVLTVFDITPLQHVRSVSRAATALNFAFSSVVTAAIAPILDVQNVPRAATALSSAFSSLVTAAIAPIDPTPSNTVQIPRAAFAAHATRLRRVFGVFEGMLDSA